MLYKLVIFDFDGTLADTFPYFMACYSQLAHKYRVAQIDPAEIDHLRGLDARQLIQQFRVPVWKMVLAGRDYRRRMTRDIHQIPLFPGVELLLNHLEERGVQMAMVSSNGKKIIHRVLGPQNAARIRYYECGVSIHGKSAKIRKVLRKCGVEPGEAIYIGDEIRDMHAARAEGVAFGGVTWGFTLPHALQAHAPELMFESVSDLIAKLG